MEEEKAKNGAFLFWLVNGEEGVCLKAFLLHRGVARLRVTQELALL